MTEFIEGVPVMSNTIQTVECWLTPVIAKSNEINALAGVSLN